MLKQWFYYQTFVLIIEAVRYNGNSVRGSPGVNKIKQSNGFVIP